MRMLSVASHAQTDRCRYRCTTLTYSGQYNDPPDYKIWGHQLSMWCVITITARLFCGCLMFLTQFILSFVAAAVAAPFWVIVIFLLLRKRLTSDCRGILGSSWRL